MIKIGNHNQIFVSLYVYLFIVVVIRMLWVPTGKYWLSTQFFRIALTRSAMMDMTAFITIQVFILLVLYRISTILLVNGQYY